jgi:ABC-type cobalamin/Fe3+-siderophores transport system ATPase subunit
MPSSNSKNSKVMNQQMSSLDDTDPLMSEWNDNLEQYQQLLLSSVTNQTSLKQQQLLWGGKGGRGRGGRGSGGGRVTIQPHDIIIPNISLEYVSDAQSGSVGSKTLLRGDDNTKLKLLSGVNDEGKHRVYALIGRNGCGKSTLLRRMHSKKIPGFINLNLKSMYIPQEVFEHDYQDQGGDNDDNVDGDNHNDPDQQRQKNPLEVILGYKKNNKKESKDAVEKKIQALEQELEIIMDSGEIDEEEMEKVCNEISLLEDQLNQDENGDNNDSDSDDDLTYKVSQILSYFGIDEIKQRTPMDKLSGGQKKKVLLASTLFCDVDVLLLDGKYCTTYLYPFMQYVFSFCVLHHYWHY